MTFEEIPLRKKKKGYSAIPLTFNRRMVIASISGNKKNAIHCVTEIDVTEPRKLIRAYHTQTGTKISFTAYIARCFAKTLEKHPGLNSFIRRNKLILLDDVTVSILVERELGSEKAPEPLGIRNAQKKNLMQIHAEIRKAQQHSGNRMGDLSGSTWVRLIPPFLLKLFIRIADKNLTLAKRYGKVAITAVGMFSKTATWFIPHGTSTVLLTVGSIGRRTENSAAGTGAEPGAETREYLHITASFDHEIVDGAPAARFIKDFSDLLESGTVLREEAVVQNTFLNSINQSQKP